MAPVLPARTLNRAGPATRYKPVYTCRDTEPLSSSREMTATSPAAATRARCPLGIRSPCMFDRTCWPHVSPPAMAAIERPHPASLEQWPQRASWPRARRHWRGWCSNLGGAMSTAVASHPCLYFIVPTTTRHADVHARLLCLCRSYRPRGATRPRHGHHGARVPAWTSGAMRYDVWPHGVLDSQRQRHGNQGWAARSCPRERTATVTQGAL